MSHGCSCKAGDCDHGGTCAEVVFDESVSAPPWANSATVFLNGWHADYSSHDHPIGHLKIGIQDVKLSGGYLKWKAIGQLADDNFYNPYTFCYYYTIIFWDNTKIRATPYSETGSGCDANNKNCHGNLNWIHKSSGSSTPLLILPSYLEIKGGQGKETAILPRGFEYSNPSAPDLLQIAYNMDHTENIIGILGYPKEYGNLVAPSLPSETSRIDTNYVSWETQATLKDSDDVQNYDFWNYITALTGEDINIIHPPFSINPRIFSPIGAVGITAIQTIEHTIENVPFEYAIPVLTGWDLEYKDWDDHPVKEIGVWLDSFDYTFDPSHQSGTLHYKISYVLHDEPWGVINPKPTPGMLDYKLNILGIKGPQQYPDLVPVPPYCDPTEHRNLAIKVRNQGKVDAPYTMTTVNFNPDGTFPGTSFDIPTPSVAAGSETIIQQPILPTSPNCFNPDCEFDVLVDSHNDARESDENNNHGHGTCKG